MARIIPVVGFMFVSSAVFRPRADDLTLVPPALVPASGTFYSLQKGDTQPPFPYNPFPSLPVYSLGEGAFLLDDSGVAYPESIDPGDAQPGESDWGEQFPAFNYTCGLWLSISASASSNNAVLLTLHNTRPSQNYVIWSITSIVSTNWVVETNVTGASGNLTDVNISMGQRTNLFLRASEERNYVTNVVFQGLSYSNTLVVPADTMGAVGQNHFVELLNNWIAVYDKSGGLMAYTNTTNFFAVLDADGTNYPTGARIVDPRILYDHQSQRWVACALDVDGSRQVILAVSNNDNPTNLTTGWSRYLVRVKRSGALADFPTLGLDDNGIYLSVLQLGSTNATHTIVAIKKPEIYLGTNFTTRLEVTNGLTSWTIQPAVNFDDVPTNGHAWFVAKGPPEGTGTNYLGGPVLYCRLQWAGTNAACADTNWCVVSAVGTNYQNYYELSGTNFSVPPSSGVRAPQGTNDGGQSLDIYSIGSRLMMAVIRNGFLWTCHTVGLGGTNGIYSGDELGTDVDRSAIQWLSFQVNPNNGTLTLSDHGRVFDPATTNAWWYHFPSLAVNCAGDMVAGFSGSSPTNYIGAFYTWRLSGGPTLNVPRLIQSGAIQFSIGGRWGDYSATTLDPTDDWSFWTVQEYAAPSPPPFETVGSWGTIITKIRPTP